MLLDEPGERSFVVIDPKGEVAAITSRYRRRVSDVMIINPYGLLVDVAARSALRQVEPARRT